MHAWFFIAAARTDVLIWGGIIAILAVVGGAGIMLYRRKVLNQDAGGSPAGFSLDDLRKLRDSGEISAQEYEVARNQVMQAVKKSLSKPRKSDKKDNNSSSSFFQTPL